LASLTRAATADKRAMAAPHATFVGGVSTASHSALGDGPGWDDDDEQMGDSDLECAGAGITHHEALTVGPVPRPGQGHGDHPGRRAVHPVSKRHVQERRRQRRHGVHPADLLRHRRGNSADTTTRARTCPPCPAGTYQWQPRHRGSVYTTWNVCKGAEFEMVPPTPSCHRPGMCAQQRLHRV